MGLRVWGLGFTQRGALRLHFLSGAINCVLFGADAGACAGVAYREYLVRGVVVWFIPSKPKPDKNRLPVVKHPQYTGVLHRVTYPHAACFCRSAYSSVRFCEHPPKADTRTCSAEWPCFPYDHSMPPPVQSCGPVEYHLRSIKRLKKKNKNTRQVSRECTQRCGCAHLRI